MHCFMFQTNSPETTMSHGPGISNYEGPNDPPPPEPEKDPTHDVPTYPPADSPPGTETAIRVDGAVGYEGVARSDGVWMKRIRPLGVDMRFIGREGPIYWFEGPGEHDGPKEGEDDVDDDDLDPQVPHSPPDGKQGRIVFDENEVPG
jgi:hypothetical protein